MFRQAPEQRLVPNMRVRDRVRAAQHHGQLREALPGVAARVLRGERARVEDGPEDALVVRAIAVGGAGDEVAEAGGVQRFGHRREDEVDDGDAGGGVGAQVGEGG